MFDDEKPVEATDEPAAKPKKSRRWLARALVTLLIVGSVSGLTWLAFNDPRGPSVEATQSTDPTNVVDVQAPAYIAGEEPIADAAEKILPSVVQIQSSTGVGSGVVYGDGLIMTAAHVVSGESTVSVRLADGEVVSGTVLGGTSEADIAVVQIDRTDVPKAELALDYTPRVGQLAIAVGSPWDLTSTVTAGIVSAINQPLGCNSGGNCRSMVQTDAAINPGNSGGPLVDREGRVLGINVSIFSLSGSNDGVGFAVPINVAYQVAQAVVNGESIEFGFLGVVGRDVEAGRAGALITEVTPDSAADLAGFAVDDLVISIDGVPVQGISDLASQVRTHRPGESVDFVIVRDGSELTLTAVLGLRQDTTG